MNRKVENDPFLVGCATSSCESPIYVGIYHSMKMYGQSISLNGLPVWQATSSLRDVSFVH